MPRSPTPSSTPSVWVEALWAWPTLTRLPTQDSGISCSDMPSSLENVASYAHSIAERGQRRPGRASGSLPLFLVLLDALVDFVRKLQLGVRIARIRVVGIGTDREVLLALELQDLLAPRRAVTLILH